MGNQQSDAIRLWEDDAPGALGQKPQDIPSLTPYFLKKQEIPSAAILIFPGGGYKNLAEHEGKGYAQYLQKLGIAAFVLKYRLGSDGYRHPCMLQDAARAMRIIRANAAEWNIDASRIGVMGSSAGGHLAAMLLTHYDEGNPGSADLIEHEKSRPDLGILCYPVISMDKFGHPGSRQSLLGENPTATQIADTSAEAHITAQTPPCFVWHTWEDTSVPVENSMEFAAALRRNGVPFDLHIYQKGAHGLGLGDKINFCDLHIWTQDLEFWLHEQRFI